MRLGKILWGLPCQEGAQFSTHKKAVLRCNYLQVWRRSGDDCHTCQDREPRKFVMVEKK